jgi:hypothetical protein
MSSRLLQAKRAVTLVGANSEGPKTNFYLSKNLRSQTRLTVFLLCVASLWTELGLQSTDNDL